MVLLFFLFPNTVEVRGLTGIQEVKPIEGDKEVE